jgi:hypothetical protein
LDVILRKNKMANETTLIGSQQKVYKLIWSADSPNPGYIDHGLYIEDHIPEDHNYDEVIGPHREFVEILPGTDDWKVWVDPGAIDIFNGDAHLIHLDINASHYDWSQKKFVYIQMPGPTWDDVKKARNSLLTSSDNMFNFDTPEPLRSEWLFYRECLRQLIENEKANGREAATVHMPVPPAPISARLINEHLPEGGIVNTADVSGDVICHRPANFEKYGARCAANAGGIDTDLAHLGELVASIKQEVTDCKGVPAQSIAPSNITIHLPGSETTLAILTDHLGGTSGNKNTIDNPVNGPTGTVIGLGSTTTGG